MNLIIVTIIALRAKYKCAMNTIEETVVLVTENL